MHIKFLKILYSPLPIFSGGGGSDGILFKFCRYGRLVSRSFSLNQNGDAFFQKLEFDTGN